MVVGMAAESRGMHPDSTVDAVDAVRSGLFDHIAGAPSYVDGRLTPFLGFVTGG
ncbi:hypothetical protein ACFV0O_02815 [Kitasatospora sp. NPDC059577]|uniref:hypothetical protein n=1 Tax=unclassified Kitasatospora TaxID=2633591 RepID=UPI003686535C